MHFRHRLAAVLVGAVIATGFAACGGGGSNKNSSSSTTTTASGSETGTSDAKVAATVQLKPTTFDPDSVSIKVGETVRWVWGGGIQHDVNGGDEFKSEIMSKGEFSHTFAKAGTFPYHCDVHPSTMKGEVTVA